MEKTDIKIEHPAKFSDKFIPIIAEILENRNIKTVFDPMAGTGKIALIRKFGFKGRIICNELESDWVNKEYTVDHWYFEDAENLFFIKNESIECICTSPTYGNRLADHWQRKDTSKRFSYSFNIGRELHEENTGKMQWGAKYRQKHESIWREMYRILTKQGLFILNISNHIRSGIEQKVAEWHKEFCEQIGFKLLEVKEIETPRLRYGKNSKSRTKCEYIFIFIK